MWAIDSYWRSHRPGSIHLIHTSATRLMPLNTGAMGARCIFRPENTCTNVAKSNLACHLPNVKLDYHDIGITSKNAMLFAFERESEPNKYPCQVHSITNHESTAHAIDILMQPQDECRNGPSPSPHDVHVSSKLSTSLGLLPATWVQDSTWAKYLESTMEGMHTY